MKKDNELIHMVSVCRKIGESEYALMTNYKLNKTSKIEQTLRGEHGRVLYMKHGLAAEPKEDENFIQSILDEENISEAGSLSLIRP